MILVTGYEHNSLITRIDSLIKEIENENDAHSNATDSICELQTELILLNKLFRESNTISEKLRLLVEEYKKRQRITRVKLRKCRMKYSK